MKRYLPHMAIIVLLLVVLLIPESALAQCPMCKASAESSLKEGSRVAVGLNRGILYLLALPYLFYATLFLIYWLKTRRKVVVE